MTPPPGGSRPTIQAWSSLWATGVVDTFGHTGAGGAGESPLAPLWRSWFGTLSPHARVLDVATGNGALPRLLLESACDSVTCDAVDIARVAPRWLDGAPSAHRARLTFHSGVDCLCLPFSDATFDAVCSQFGVEYAGLDAALSDILRVLSPEGQLRLVVHADSGRPAQLAREELSHIEWLQREGWWEAANQMVTAMAMLARPNGRERLSSEPRWNGVRHRFDSLQQDAADRAAGSECPDLLLDMQNWVAQVFRVAALHGPEAGHSGFQRLKEAIVDTEARLRDLLEHVLDADAADRAVRWLQQQGRRAQMQPARDQGHHMGWWITAF